MSKFRIDRHFLFLHNEKLTAFSERILRATADNSNLVRPDEIWNSLQQHLFDLRAVLNSNAYRKQQEKTILVRELETYLLMDLNRMADYIENHIGCRSDVFTTGFRSQTEQRKVVQTRRRQRIVSKMEQISDSPSSDEVRKDAFAAKNGFEKIKKSSN
jgi:hypothetical protein